ncbi:MAG: GNAT family N-acetyltransferase [Alphaproteobacteria bacterium]|nr:GNAT family N-acetyltransferase [Alphaproteobacteria bacterium]
MIEYALPKSGGTARATILGMADMVDVLALQETTRATLPADKKMFVLPQPTSYFQKLLSCESGMMIGIRSSEGLLIGQMALMGPMRLSEAIAKNLITSNEVSFHHAGLNDSVIIFKSMATHPAFRGNNLGANLVGFALDLPFTRVADHVFAQVSVGNKRSWDVFAKNGFGIVAAAYDVNDDQPRFIFQKPAIDFDLSPEISADDVDAVEDFDAIVTLTQQEAMIGFYERGSTERLSFRESEDTSIIMPTLAKVEAAQ